eukprot:349653-Chlamydomonas_euryale.AAC.4
MAQLVHAFGLDEFATRVLRGPACMLYRIYIVPALLYALPETSDLMDQQLRPLVRAHNAYMRHITSMLVTAPDS